MAIPFEVKPGGMVSDDLFGKRFVFYTTAARWAGRLIAVDCETGWLALAEGDLLVHISLAHIVAWHLDESEEDDESDTQ